MSACLLWNKAVNSAGYGVTWVGGKQQYIHRVVAKAKEGEVVLHTCDNKLCINPDHLRLGSYQDNSLDMVMKGRQAKGEVCGNAKLSEEAVLLIRGCEGLLSSRETGKKFNISKTNVLDIWKRNTWKHLE